MRYRLYYDLPKKFGTFVGTYFVHSTTTDTKMFSPGDYIYGEPLTGDEVESVADEDLRDPDIAVVVESLEAEEEEYPDDEAVD